MTELFLCLVRTNVMTVTSGPVKWIIPDKLNLTGGDRYPLSEAKHLDYEVENLRIILKLQGQNLYPTNPPPLHLTFFSVQ